MIISHIEPTKALLNTFLEGIPTEVVNQLNDSIEVEYITTIDFSDTATINTVWFRIVGSIGKEFTYPNPDWLKKHFEKFTIRVHRYREINEMGRNMGGGIELSHERLIINIGYFDHYFKFEGTFWE